MEVRDILAETHKMEGSDMTHPQSESIAETIGAAVAPLATKEDLEATRADIAALRKETRDDAKIRQDQLNAIKKPWISGETLTNIFFFIAIGMIYVLAGVNIGKSL